MIKQIGNEKTENGEDTQKNMFLIFNLGNEAYGIEIIYVTEIIGMQQISEVPELPEYIKGIVNLRGKIIPIMDVRTKFKKEYREYDDRTCIIVVEIENVSIGLVVDGVAEVISIQDEEIASPPEVNKKGNKYIRGIGKTQNHVVLLLDCIRLINDEETHPNNDINNKEK